MKLKMLLFCLAVLPSLLLLSCKNHIDTMNVMTFNIRYDSPNDTANPWSIRKDWVADLIKYHNVDIVGTQEGLNHQIAQLDGLLPDYTWLGVGRDNGKSEGEYCAIFYKKNKYEVLENATFWLSKNPTKVASKSWDAAITRIVTWAKFKNRSTGKAFYVFNTHFDHRGQKAREESAMLINQKVAEIAGENPVILLGDFNINRDNAAYTTLTSHFKDTETLTTHYGSSYTYTGFQPFGNAGNTIDYIFLKNWTGAVNSHATLGDTWDGKYPSDHLPVLVNMGI